jgi:hypothetical protein
MAASRPRLRPAPAKIPQGALQRVIFNVALINGLLAILRVVRPGRPRSRIGASPGA